MSDTRSRSQRLTMTGIVGHAVVSGGAVRTWYRLPTTGWAYRPASIREQMMTSLATGYAGLVGRDFHVRVTSRPWSVRDWAQAHHERAQAPGAGWSEHLIACQQQLSDRSLAVKETYIGVSVPTSALAQAAGGLRHATAPRSARLVVSSLAKQIAETDKLLLTGMGARPVAADDLAWLLHRSTGLGLPAPHALRPAPDDWEKTDLDEITVRSHWEATPLGKTIRVIGELDDLAQTSIERHVCVLSIGRMMELDVPRQHEPWLHRLDRLPFSVEVSLRGHIERDAAVRSQMRHTLQTIRAQVDHYREHREPPPSELARQAATALEVEEELTGTLSGLATRSTFWARVAVSGSSQEEALERAAAVRSLCEPRVTVHRMIDQYAGAREFIPGEPMASKAHTRRAPVVTLAGAMPQATSQWGDRHGLPIGEASGISSDAAVVDLWDGPEHNVSGLIPIAAGLGGGKSMLGGWITYLAAMSGVHCTWLDPSGRLHKLAQLPELRDRSRVVDLLDSPPGALSPYRVIADPDPRYYMGNPDELAKRTEFAKRSRRELAMAVLQQLLPSAMAANELTEAALLDAVAKVPAIRQADLGMVVGRLDSMGGADDDEGADPDLAAHARRLARLYRRLAETAVGRLLFANRHAGTEIRADSTRPILTVFSLRGVKIPDEQSAELSIDERLGMCLLTCASWLVSHDMYFGDPDERKLVGLDEARVLRRVQTGRSLMESLSADSRKHNTVALVLDQMPSHLVQLGLPALSGAAFMGRMTDEREQMAALEFLELDDEAYASVFAGLSQSDTTITGDDVAQDDDRTPREFVARDWQGRVERIRVLLDSHPHVFAALSSTSRASRRVLVTHDEALDIELTPEPVMS